MNFYEFSLYRCKKKEDETIGTEEKNKSLIDIQSNDNVHESIKFRYASFALQFVCA